MTIGSFIRTRPSSVWIDDCLARGIAASYVIDNRADFIGRQQHVAFLGGVDHSAIAEDRPMHLFRAPCAGFQARAG
jgi:hypothetical protein